MGDWIVNNWSDHTWGRFMIVFEDSESRDKGQIFIDRVEAGEVLARMLRGRIPASGIVMAIPSGGVPVARAITDALRIELGVVVVRKIQIPWNTEAGLGAVGPDGEPVFNLSLLARLELTKEELSQQLERARRSVRERERLFLKGGHYPRLEGRDVVLVDDGLASGYTMLAAVKFVRGRGARRVSVAVPTASVGAIKVLEDIVDELYCANLRTGSVFAVADAYKHWRDIPEEEARALL